MASTRITKAFRHYSLSFLNHRLSARAQPRPVAAVTAAFCRQMSTNAHCVAARLSSSGFIRSQGFIGGKWTGAYDGKTIELATKFRNSGQTCVCANRVLVQEGIFEKFVNAFTKAVESMRVAHGFAEGAVQVGPLINDAALHKVDSFVQDAISKGAKVLTGGKKHSLGMTFYEPTVLTDIKSEMTLSREEIFGPVAPLQKFKTEEEAIHMANDTNAGLAAYIFTSNMQRSWRVSEALEYGKVGVNEELVSAEVAPFDGVKQSGLGREGSKYGMDEYLETKYICLGNMN